MRRILPNFSSMLGFGITGVPSGFCGGIAVLGANRQRPSVTNAGYTLSPAGAKKLYDLALARKWCALNGAMNIYGAYYLWSAIASGAHTLVDVPHFNLTKYHNDVRANAGIAPILTLWNNGQAFPRDEMGLHYHFSTIGGTDTEMPVEGLIGGYAFCDDDSRDNVRPAEANPPIWHDWPTIIAAGPMAYIIGAH